MNETVEIKIVKKKYNFNLILTGEIGFLMLRIVSRQTKLFIRIENDWKL